jgi:tetratricopeptide (TPR) repeat protein
MSPPNREFVARLIAENQALIESQPQLLAISAEALASSGARARALERLERSYAMFRRMIASDELSERTLDSWFDSVGRVFGPDRLEEAQAFALEQSGGEPSMVEHRALARMWAVSGRFDQAVELMQKAIDLAPEDPAFVRGMLRRTLGDYYAAMGRWSDSADAFEAALEAVPNDVTMLNNLSFILAEELDDAGTALPYAQKAAELSPNDPNVIDTLGRVLFLRGDLEEAERKLRDSIRIAEMATTYVHLADVYLAQGDIVRASRALERAEELNPDPRTEAEIARIADDIRTRGAGGR